MLAKKLLQLTAVLVMGVLLVQCNNNKKPNVENKDKKEAVVDATDYKSWVYFSFEKGQVVATKNVKENFGKDGSWDIAFHRYDFRTNGGASGEHKGAVAETAEKDITKEIPAPVESQFTKDVLGQVLVRFEAGQGGKHEMERAELPLNYVLTTRKGASGIEHAGAIASQGMPPVVTLSGKVYVVRTASGKLVKFKVTDYRDAHAVTGHIKFEYMFM